MTHYTSAVGLEGYELDVQKDVIRIVGADEEGLFYGAQTLNQLLAFNRDKNRVTLPCMKVRDRPRFHWRGLLLDTSRTFLTLEYLQRTIDRMAEYKLNVLHLHLTDDQGWRFEIKKYPRLTSIGSSFDARYGCEQA